MKAIMRFVLTILFSVVGCAAGAQGFPDSPMSKASSPNPSIAQPGIEPPPSRPFLPPVDPAPRKSAPANIPLSKEAQEQCTRYFEKHKKELSACKVQ
jgi:hypothetical protein